MYLLSFSNFYFVFYNLLKFSLCGSISLKGGPSKVSHNLLMTCQRIRIGKSWYSHHWCTSTFETRFDALSPTEFCFSSHTKNTDDYAKKMHSTFFSHWKPSVLALISPMDLQSIKYSGQSPQWVATIGIFHHTKLLSSLLMECCKDCARMISCLCENPAEKQHTPRAHLPYQNQRLMNNNFDNISFLCIIISSKQMSEIQLTCFPGT